MRKTRFVRYDDGDGNGFFRLGDDGEWHHSKPLDDAWLIVAAIVGSMIGVWLASLALR